MLASSSPLRRASRLLLAALLLSGCGGGGDPVPEGSAHGETGSPPGLDGLDPGRHFGSTVGTFALMNGQTGEWIRHDAERSGRRYLPASTFKIPNALIALETGVATGPDFPLAWDSIRDPRQEWWPATWAGNQTLRSALPASTVWYFQEIARRIGADRMARYLSAFDYGNADISGGIDQFWLTGGLGISADEQVEFLRRFHAGELGVTERSTELVKEILLLEETATYRLSGKTGWVGLAEPGASEIGWLVGYVERGDEVHFFAMNMDMPNSSDAPRRMEITRTILTDAGLLD